MLFSTSFYFKVSVLIFICRGCIKTLNCSRKQNIYIKLMKKEKQHSICFIQEVLSTTSFHLLHPQKKASDPFLMCMKICVLAFSSDISSSPINRDIYTSQESRVAECFKKISLELEGYSPHNRKTLSPFTEVKVKKDCLVWSFV